MLTDPVLRPMTGLGPERFVEELSLPLAGVASLLSPVTRAVSLPLGAVAERVLPRPIAAEPAPSVEELAVPFCACDSSLLDTLALFPVTRAVSLGLGAVAERLVPRSIAADPAPSVEELAVPFCTCDSWSVDTLALLPCEPESGGLANAGHGVAARPAPMPSATANAPTRPI